MNGMVEGAWEGLQAKVKAYKQRVEHPHPGDMQFSKNCGLKVLTIATGTTTATIVVLPTILDILGFGAGGVTVESAAARWQSAIGNVKAGSLFALLQSIAMGGLAGSAFVLSGTTLGFSGAFVAVGKVCRKDEYHIVPTNVATLRGSSSSENES